MYFFGKIWTFREPFKTKSFVLKGAYLNRQDEKIRLFPLLALTTKNMYGFSRKVLEGFFLKKKHSHSHPHLPHPQSCQLP